MERTAGSFLDSYRLTDRIEAGAKKPEAVEAVEAAAPAECQRPISFAREVLDPSTGECTLDRLTKPCGCKSCAYCGPQLRRRMVAHFSKVFGALDFVKFITLTLDPKCGVPVRDSRKFLLDCFSRFRKRMNRRGGRFIYVGTLEEHQSGYFHLHLVCSVDVPAADMRAAWFECGGGIVMDVEDVAASGGNRVARVVGYIMKYAFKGAVEAHKARESRRSVIASRGIGYRSEAAREARMRHVEKSRKEKSTGVGGDPPRVIVSNVEAYRAALHEALLKVVSQRGRVSAFGGGRAGRLVQVLGDVAGVLFDGDDAVSYVDCIDLVPDGMPVPRMERYEPLVVGGALDYGDKITAEDRERFEGYRRRTRWIAYRHTSKDGRQVVYRYDRNTGKVEATEMVRRE